MGDRLSFMMSLQPQQAFFYDVKTPPAILYDVNSPQEFDFMMSQQSLRLSFVMSQQSLG